MIAGYHVIFGMYGFWLPNDPRGSWSKFVGSWELFRYGPATKTTERRSVAHQPHDHQQRVAAKSALQRPAVKVTGIQARAVGRSFGIYAERSGFSIWECAILPDHVHLVIGRPHLTIEQLVIRLKSVATTQLIKEGIHPFGGDGKCFARGEWKVYLDPPDIPRAIRYVAENPIKEGLPQQRWSFVKTLEPEDALRSEASRRG